MLRSFVDGFSYEDSMYCRFDTCPTCKNYTMCLQHTRCFLCSPVNLEEVEMLEYVEQHNLRLTKKDLIPD